MKERIEEQEYRAIYNFLSEKKCPFEITPISEPNEFYGALLPKWDLSVFKHESFDFDFPSVKNTIQRIRRLDLSGLETWTGSLPFSFRFFSSLEVLSFNSSDFVVLPYFNTLPKLKYLDLSDLPGLWFYPKFDGLENLEVLVLRFLVIDRDMFSDDMFSSLVGLRVLDLRNSFISNFSFFKSLEGLKNLEYVDLRGADYTKPIPSLDCEILTGLDLGYL